MLRVFAHTTFGLDTDVTTPIFSKQRHIYSRQRHDRSNRRMYSYSNTSQLDLWGGGNLGGSEGNKLGLELLEFLLESLLWLLSESVGLDLLGWSLGHL